MIIRVIERKDLEEIDAIYNEAIKLRKVTADTEPYNWQKRIDWFEAHPEDTYPVFVAESDNKVLGYIHLSPYRAGRDALRKVAEISYFVAEDNRGRGLGTALMDFAIPWAQKKGFSNLIAILIEHNAASIYLLKKFGFELWGTMPGIAEFNNKRYDHLYYGKKLT